MRSIPRHTDRAGHRNLSAVEGWSLVAKCLYVLISALLGLLLSTFIVYGSSVVKMTYEANRMITSAENLANAALGCGSDEGLSESSHRLVTSARKLRDELDTTKWSLVRDHSTVGADITAVRTMLNAVGNLAEGPFTDLMNLSQRLSGFSMEDKTVDVGALLEVPGIVDNAHTSIETEVEALNQVPEPSIAQVASLVAAGRNALQSVDELLSQYDDLVELIPQLLGADGQRTYLVAIYNNAELRSGGGMVGNVAPITVDAGKVTIGDFEVTSAYKYGTGPFDSQNLTEGAVFGSQVYSFPQTTTVNPDFQRAAETLKNMWNAQDGNQNINVAGVIAIDPVVMQALIGATADVTLSDGRMLNGQNTAKFFLSDLYVDYPDSDTQDPYTNEASKAIMTSVFSHLNSGSASGVLRAIRTVSASSHLKLWMADDNELAALIQTKVLDLNVAGMLPDDPLNPTAGVYVTEAEPSKLDWYLDTSMTVTKTCGDNFAQSQSRLSNNVNARPRSTSLQQIATRNLGDEYTVEFTMHNTMTEEQAESLPVYVTGANGSGTMQPRLFFMAPAGGEITSIAYETGEFAANGVADGHQFINLRLTGGIAPGETVTVAFTVRVAEQAASPLNVVTTPIVTEQGEFTGSGGAVVDQCGADVPDAQQDQRYGTGTTSGTDDGSDAAAGDSATPGPLTLLTPSATPSDGSSAQSDEGALDSLDQFRGAMSCPVRLRSLIA